ncbi:MAG: AI-2E family transporter [Sulfuricurvum sp.]|uniref:AI-2E family transporter n=1 Tax=Sulfuricurvum sp. TaxID=2025608 RepID=UPI002735F132|nr:AI-2E family transporter [Sulfuricurvum sp.]MDP3291210.1 AI-2E family transporter [Sulfuricurvum sp.]
MENKLFVRFMIFSALGLVMWLFLPFLKSFFIAFLLAIVVSPLYRAVEAKIRTIGRLSSMASVISAGIVTLGLSLILFVPIAMFLYYLFDQPANVVGTLRALSDQIDTITDYLPTFLGWMKEPLDNLILLGKAHKDEIIATLAAWLGNGLQTFMVMLAEMAMIVVFFFFLSWYGRSMMLFILPIIPLSRTIKRAFFSDMMTTTAVVFYSLGGVMLAQGLAFGIFIAFFEGYNPFLLGFMTAISAVIPVVGTALIWVPVALHEYFEGNIMNALIISLYSWAMMAFFIDNIVKLLILNFVNRKLSDGKNRMNEFMIFFAIVGGLATFGFWGFIFGPAIVAFTLTTLRMLRKTSRHLR